MEGSAHAKARSRNVISSVLQPSHSVLGQLIKFGIAGGVATIADCGVLWLFLLLFEARQIVLSGFRIESYLIYNTVSYTIGATVSYILSVNYVFPHRKIKNRHLEFAIFLLIAFGGWALTSLIMHLGMQMIEAFGIMRILGHLHRLVGFVSLAPRELAVMLVKCVAIVLVFFYNFGVRKVIMFSGPR